MAKNKQVSGTNPAEIVKGFENEIEKPAQESKAEAQREELNTPAALPPNAELVEQWDREWESGKESAIPTGFDNLDKLLDGGLYPGLYTIGAISSLGKTTFILQIADTIAAAGKDVLYITLEQSAEELAAKSLSRLTAILHESDPGKRLTYRQITSKTKRARLGPEQKNGLTEAVKTYKSGIGQHFFTLPGIGDIGVNQIKKQIEAHQKARNNTPVVFVDYAQILAAPAGERLTDKQVVDKNIVELKRMARDFNTPIVAVSSFNRENYAQRVSMAAFKESGAIEYTSDCIIGIQPQGLELGEKKTAENQEKIEACRNSTTRHLEAIVLKNRQGAIGGVYLDYNTLFNLYTDTGEMPNQHAKKASGNSKHPVTSRADS